MAIDHRQKQLNHFSDVRRWVALRTHGTVRFIDSVQSSVEDVEGAISAKQYGVAAYSAQFVILTCLSIRSLLSGGAIEFDESSVSYDFFAGLDESVVTAALSLANEALDLNEVSAGEWLEHFHAYVQETERFLSGERIIPVLRSPQGSMTMLSLVRRWSSLLEELELPPLMPTRWASTDKNES